MKKYLRPIYQFFAIERINLDVFFLKGLSKDLTLTMKSFAPHQKMINGFWNVAFGTIGRRNWFVSMFKQVRVQSNMSWSELENDGHSAFLKIG